MVRRPRFLLEDFVVWLVVSRPSGRFLGARTAAKYASTVRAWYHRRTRRQLGVGASAGRLRQIAQGMLRDITHPPPRERVGVTPADLSKAMDGKYGARGAPGASGEQQMWRACFSTMLTGLMRGCEVGLDDVRRERWEEEQHVTPVDVSFFTTGGGRHVQMQMRKRKDLRVLRGKHSTVFLAGGGSMIDAPKELEVWMQRRAALFGEESGALFCHASGECVTVSEIRDEIRDLMMSIGRDPSLYGAHSLRIGGATAMLAAGVAPQLIRLMGRWSSDVYEIYCRMSVESALAAGTALASATVTSTATVFEFEHLELLPIELADAERLTGAGGDEASGSEDEETGVNYL